MDRIEVGRLGEDMAAAYLIKLGYKILARNYRCSIGEIDIIAFYKGELIFVEVRTKRSGKYGTPAESITSPKMRKLRRVAEHYILNSKPAEMPLRKSEVRLRFDLIGIELTNEKTDLQHIRGIF